jgi:hypothetical protein
MELKELSAKRCESASVRDAIIEGEKLCDERGKLVILNCEGEQLKWLIVLGNNMKKGNRAQVLRRGVFEVSTLDDHTCAGIGREKYHARTLKDFRVSKCVQAPLTDDDLNVDYEAMGEVIYQREVQETIANHIKAGIFSVVLSFVLAVLI